MRIAVAPFHLIDGAVLRAHQGRQLREQHLADRRQIPLALHHAGEPCQVGLQPVLLGVLIRGRAKVLDHGIDVVFELGHCAAGIHLNGTSEIALRNSGRHIGNGAHLSRKVRRQQVHVIREVFPDTGGAGDVRLTAQAALDADFLGDAGHLFGKDRQCIGHVVDGFSQGRHFALGFDRQLLFEAAIGHSGHDFDDAADLRREICSHNVDVIRQIFPRACHSRHDGLAAELAFGADFAGDSGHFGGKPIQLVDHRVGGFFELQDFAADIDGDLLREIAVWHGNRNFGDVADLGGEITGHETHAFGQIFPNAAHVANLRLAAELAFGADLARDAGDFGRERVQLIDHRVHGFFELQDFAADIDGDLLGEVAIEIGRASCRDVAELAGYVAGHQTHAVRQIFPGAGDARHGGLAAELAFGADFAGDAGDFGGETPQLIDHRVDGILELQDFAADIDGDFLGEVAIGDGDGHVGDVADLRGQIAGHNIDALGEILPDAAHIANLRLAAELAFGADLAGNAGHFGRETPQLIDHRVDGFFELQDLAMDVDGDLL